MIFYIFSRLLKQVQVFLGVFCGLKVFLHWKRLRLKTSKSLFCFFVGKPSGTKHGRPMLLPAKMKTCQFLKFAMAWIGDLGAPFIIEVWRTRGMSLIILQYLFGRFKESLPGGLCCLHFLLAFPSQALLLWAEFLDLGLQPSHRNPFAVQRKKNLDT